MVGPAPVQYRPVADDPDAPTRPGTMASRFAAGTLLLFDVDDAPMLQRRDLVMNICMVQVAVSFVLLTNWRRSPVLLILQPFFMGAGVLGWYGAKHCKSVYVAAHFMGSAGLALVFMVFILAETFLKHAQGQQNASADLFFIILNAPFDLFLLTTSWASVVLFLSLRQLKRSLQQRRDQIREQFESRARGEGWGGPASVPAGMAGVELTNAGAAAEVRRMSVKNDLRCPITLEVMRDPVIAGDGHSYERAAMERWLRTHRTSPLTGRAMPSLELLPNHRLRMLIQDLEQPEVTNTPRGNSARGASLPSASATVETQVAEAQRAEQRHAAAAEAAAATGAAGYELDGEWYPRERQAAAGPSSYNPGLV